MEKQTALQFQATQAPTSDAQVQSRCGQCGRRFRVGARFCPYDGDALSSTDAAETDPLVGGLVDGRYEVLRVLGEGGMGVVYGVRHSVLGREFALKALRADIAAEEHLSERFLREAQSAASINHPNVCEITDFGELPGKRPYFVMELLTGEPLSVWLERGPLSVDRVVRLSEQIARALEAAHAAGVVHRDLKPDNILVEVGPTDERVKVADFGLARVAGQSRLTQPGVVFGTPHYMSPEQASGGAIDQRSDIYALGVVMYEMLTGKVPFEAETYMGVLSKHLYQDPVVPTQLLGNSEIGALQEIVLRCMRKKADERYASMSEMLADLTSIVRVDAGRVSIRPGQLHASDIPPATTNVATADIEADARVDAFEARARRAPLGLALAAAVALVLAIVGASLWGTGKVSNSVGDRPPDETTTAIETAASTSEGTAPAHRDTEAPARLVAGPETLASAPVFPLEEEEDAPKPLAPAKRQVEHSAAPTGSASLGPPHPAAPDPKDHSKRLPSRKKPSNFQTSEIIDPWSQ